MILKILYALLLLIMPSLLILIYKKIAEPLSSYIVEGNIEIKECEFSLIYNENKKLLTEISKLKKIIKNKNEKGD